MVSPHGQRPHFRLHYRLDRHHILNDTRMFRITSGHQTKVIRDQGVPPSYDHQVSAPTQGSETSKDPSLSLNWDIQKNPCHP